jgi:hypothetical protein
VHSWASIACATPAELLRAGWGFSWQARWAGALVLKMS